jgi:tetratricopeptide (TPR) repeat protein/4-amino-4-deoxy-L-arabinose transferase-like glycosyltransferase
MSNGTRRLLFMIVLAVALAVRLAYFLEARSGEWYAHPRLDALFHDRWALSIVQGNLAGDSVFFRAPLYPYLLAAVYAVAGHSYDAPRIFQHFLGWATVACVFLLARRVYGFPAAVLAALLTALSAVLVYFEGELLFDSVVAAISLFWLTSVESIWSKDRPLLHLLSGMLFGLICVTRPTFLALALPLFVWIAIRVARGTGARGGLRAGAGLLLGCFLMVAPVTLRNWIVGGDFVLISSQGGINFYIGNNPHADGVSASLPLQKGPFWGLSEGSAVAEAARGHPLSPSEESAYWFGEGWKFIRDHPGDFLSLLLKKISLFWNYREIPNNRSFSSVASESRVLSILPIGFRIVGSLGLLGILLAFVNGRGRLMAGFVLLYTAVTAMFFVTDRFRVPVLPVLNILGAYALTEVYAIARRRAYRQLAGVVGAGLLSGSFVGSNAYAVSTDDPAREEFMRGLIDLQDGRGRAAADHFRATASMRRMPNLHASWGLAAWQTGDTSEAVLQFRSELEITPGSSPSLASLAFIGLTQGRIDRAMALADSAVYADPRLPAGYIAAALAHQASRRFPEAESVLVAGRKMVRGSFLYGDYLLAGIRFRRTGDIDAADSTFRAILHALARPRQPLYEPEFDYGVQSAAGLDDRTLQAYAAYKVAHVAVARGNLDSAYQWFSRAAQILPAFADAWADCGVTLLRLGQLTGAESCLARATELNPDRPLYWYNLGVTRRELQKTDSALAAFRRSVGLAPQFRPAAEAVAKLEGERSR